MEAETQAETQTYQSKGGKLGGLSKSESKIAAARLNGRLGGRPRKTIVDDIWSELQPYDEGKYAQLAYPGGKGRLAPHILEMMPRTGRLYCEPFCGRANVFFAVASELHYSYHWLNDLRTVPFLRAVQAVGDRVIVPERTVANGHHYQALAKQGDQAALTLEPYFTYAGAGYGRGGMKRGRGGVTQAGYQRGLPRCAKILRDTAPWLTALDWAQMGLERLTADDLVYFDPPYIGYNTHSYSDRDIDHEALVAALKRAPYRWILSEYRHPLYVKAFGKPWTREMPLIMASFIKEDGHRRKRVECLWKNF